MRYSTILIILTASYLTFGEGLRIGVDGGISKSNVTGSEQWNTGVAIGINLLYAPANNIMFGIRGAYNRWSPDADSILNLLPAGLTEDDVSGSGTVWEAVPFLRIATNIPGSQVGLFGHFGAGLYFISSDVSGEGTTADGTPFSLTVIDSSDNVWGISMGLGISIGNLYGFGLEFLPLYHVLDINNSPIQYYTISLGLTYEF